MPQATSHSPHAECSTNIVQDPAGGNLNESHLMNHIDWRWLYKETQFWDKTKIRRLPKSSEKTWEYVHTYQDKAPAKDNKYIWSIIIDDHNPIQKQQSFKGHARNAGAWILEWRTSQITYSAVVYAWPRLPWHIDLTLYRSYCLEKHWGLRMQLGLPGK